jgi:hypothetical protein
LQPHERHQIAQPLSLKATLERIKFEAEDAVKRGVENIILTDEFTDVKDIDANYHLTAATCKPTS